MTCATNLTIALSRFHRFENGQKAKPMEGLKCLNKKIIATFSQVVAQITNNTPLGIFHSPACSSVRFLAASSLCFRMMANRARSPLASSVFPCACNFWYLCLAFCFSISSRSRRDNSGFGPVPICSTYTAKENA